MCIDKRTFYISVEELTLHFHYSNTVVKVVPTLPLKGLCLIPSEISENTNSSAKTTVNSRFFTVKCKPANVRTNSEQSNFSSISLLSLFQKGAWVSAGLTPLFT